MQSSPPASNSEASADCAQPSSVHEAAVEESSPGVGARLCISHQVSTAVARHQVWRVGRSLLPVLQDLRMGLCLAGATRSPRKSIVNSLSMVVTLQQPIAAGDLGADPVSGGHTSLPGISAPCSAASFDTPCTSDAAGSSRSSPVSGVTGSSICTADWPPSSQTRTSPRHDSLSSASSPQLACAPAAAADSGAALDTASDSAAAHLGPSGNSGDFNDLSKEASYEDGEDSPHTHTVSSHSTSDEPAQAAEAEADRLSAAARHNQSGSAIRASPVARSGAFRGGMSSTSVG